MDYKLRMVLILIDHNINAKIQFYMKNIIYKFSSILISCFRWFLV